VPQRPVADAGIGRVVGFDPTRDLFGDIRQLGGDPMPFGAGVRPALGPGWKDDLAVTMPFAHRSSQVG
jgi:hypothetical protein